MECQSALPAGSRCLHRAKCMGISLPDGHHMPGLLHLGVASHHISEHGQALAVSHAAR